jgi:excisionase family DNA binding protein
MHEFVSQSTRSKHADLPRATYTLAEYAAIFGVSYTTAHEGAKAGTLPVEPIRIGRRYLFPKAQVDRLLGLDADDAA